MDKPVSIYIQSKVLPFGKTFSKSDAILDVLTFPDLLTWSTERIRIRWQWKYRVYVHSLLKEMSLNGIIEKSEAHKHILSDITKTLLPSIRISAKKHTCNLQNNYGSEKEKHSSNNDPDFIDAVTQIIKYLNEKAGSNFKVYSKNTQKQIRGRLNAGFTVDDFRTVIDNKVAQWLNTEHGIYLRPETLFCDKHFESYLNEKRVKAPEGCDTKAVSYEEMQKIRQAAYRENSPEKQPGNTNIF